jgi:hypothetical protein
MHAAEQKHLQTKAK